MPSLIPKDPKLAWTMLYAKRPGTPEHALLAIKDMACFFWARNAIYHGLKALEITPGANILVPSYICAAAVEPILIYGANVRFYDIAPDGAPNFDDLLAKIDPHTRAILAVHYFGFPQPMQALKKLCATANLYLIEDCAHVLQGESDGVALGSWGDISIYSWRKFLPIYDGGQLVINNPQLHVTIPWQTEPLLLRLKVAKALFDRLLEDSTHPLTKTVSGLLYFPQAIMRSVVSSMGKQRTAVVSTDSTSLDFDLSLVNVPMTSLSKRLLRCADVPAIVQHRRHNYSYLLNAIRAFSEVTPFFPDLPPGVCPLAFPLLVHERCNLHLDLRARGIPAVTWGGVIHPAFPPGEFPMAHHLYHHLLSLPVHQSLSSGDLQTMVAVLAEALHNG